MPRPLYRTKICVKAVYSRDRDTLPMKAPRIQLERIVDYRTLAALRYQIRRFLRTREVAARAARVEPQHYLVLLQIKGLVEDEQPATVGALAERLQLRHHTVVELVDRLATKGLVVRRRSPADRRQVVVELRPAGRCGAEAARPVFHRGTAHRRAGLGGRLDEADRPNHRRAPGPSQARSLSEAGSWPRRTLRLRNRPWPHGGGRPDDRAID